MISFFKRFHLTKQTIVNVLHQIEIQLQFPYDSGVHVSTACRVVKRVSEAIAQLCPQFIQMPTTPAETIAAHQHFHAIAGTGFPRVLGAVDWTHVKIIAPGGDAELFRNRKGYFSINVQAVSSADLRFSNIVAR